MGILRRKKRANYTKNKRNIISIFLYALIIFITFIIVMPFFWMFISSFKPAVEIIKIPPKFLPQTPTLRTYVYIFEKLNFLRYFLNSFIVSTGATLLMIFSGSLTGYVFAKFNFKYKEVLFGILLSTLMVPFVARILPLYVLIARLGWTDRFVGLIMPMGLNVFGIFLMRQFITNIPSSLLEAARIDGASEWWIYVKVIIPLSLPALSALTIFWFMFSWNNLLWPLLVTSRENMQTITLAIASLQWEASIRYDIVITGATVSVIPILIIYAFANKTFIRGLSMTGLKY